MVAAYRSLEFFDHPSLESYKTLLKAAEATGQWSTVREALIRFLEVGSRPDVPNDEAPKNRKSKSGVTWPLPPTEISVCSRRTARHHFPDVSTLMKIAIYEKDTDEIMRRYNLAKSSRILGGYFLDEVAEAVKKSHPDVSLEIWEKLAEEQIKLVKPAAYEVAAGYLRKMRDIYQKIRRVDEWDEFIQTIRARHKPKRSLMKILDTLEAKRILDS